MSRNIPDRDTGQPSGETKPVSGANAPGSSHRGRASRSEYNDLPRYVYRPNWWLILPLVTASLMLVAGSYFLRKYQLSRNSEVFRNQAYAAFERGTLSQALSWMRRYLRLNPTDVEALADFGTWVEKSASDGNSYLLAFLTYESVLRKTPERHDIRRKLIDVAMALGRFSDALHHIGLLLKDNPDDVELIGKSARCEAGLGHYRRAIRLYQQAIDHDPQNLQWHTGLIGVAWSARGELSTADLLPESESAASQASPSGSAPAGDGSTSGTSAPPMRRTYDEVLHEWLARMVDQGQPKWRALLFRGQFYLEKGDIDAAEADLAAAEELQPEQIDVHLQLAQLKLRRADQAREAGRPAEAASIVQEARAFIENSLQNNPQDVRLLAALSQIQLVQGRLAEAEQTLRQAIPLCSEQLEQAQAAADKEQTARLGEVRQELHFLLADLLISRIESDAERTSQLVEEFEKVFEDARKFGLDEGRRGFLRGRLHAARRSWRAAREALEAARPQLVSVPALRQRTDLLLGRCAEMLQNPDERVRVFRRALDADPAWLLGRLQLAEALAQAGILQEAIDQYRSLIHLRGVPALLADVLIAQQMRLPATARDWRPIVQLVDQSLAVDADQPALHIRKAQLLYLNGDFSQATNLLKQLREKYPSDVAVWEASIRLCWAEPDAAYHVRLTNAQDLFGEAKQHLGDRVELRLALAAGVPGLEVDAREESLLALRSDTDGYDPVDALRLRDGLARVAMGLGLAATAERLWREALSFDTDTLSPYLGLADVAMQRRDSEAIGKLLPEIRRLEGANGPHGNYFEAVALMLALERDIAGNPGLSLSSDPRVEQISELLRQVANQRPAWPVPHALLGELAYQTGEKSSAVEHLRRAVMLGDRSARLVALLAGTLVELNRSVEAQALIQQTASAQSGEVVPELARLSWQLAWEQRDISTAESIAEKVATATNDLRDLIWLSQIRQARGAMGPEAEEPLRKAVELYPTNPSSWRALVAFLVRANRASEAEGVIDQAVSALPSEPAFLRPVFRGECAEILGKLDDAEKYYKQALESDSLNYRLRIVLADFLTRHDKFSEAESHLRFLMDEKNNIPRLAAEWARSRLAGAIAGRGTYTDVLEALALVVHEPSQDRQVELIRLRTRAAILARRTTWRERRQLIATLEQIDSLEPLTPDDRFVLASGYLLTGDRDKALALLRQLVQQDLTRNDWMATLVRALLESRPASPSDLQEARQWVEQLVKSHPNAPSTLESRLRLLAAQGNSEEAESLVAGILAGANNQDGQPVNLLQLARLCADLRLDRAAELVYQSAADKDSTSPVALDYVRFLGDRGRVEDAFRQIEKSRTHGVPLSQLLRLVTALLARNEVPSEQLEFLTKWVIDGIRQEADSPRAQMALAELYLVQGDLIQAERVYRRILGEEPANIVALNNLAWVYALEGRQLEEALRLVDKAIAAVGPSGMLLDTRAMVLAANRQLDQAVSLLEEAVKDTSHPYIWFHLADVYHRTGRKAEAAAAFREAVKQGFQAHMAPPPERARVREVERQLRALTGSEL